MRNQSPLSKLLWASCVMCLLTVTIHSARAQITDSFTQPYQQVELAISELGTIQKLHVKLGQRVKPDQIVAELDNRALLASQKLARSRANSLAAYEAAEAAAEMAQRRLDNVNQARENGHASVVELELVKFESKKAAAELRLASENIEQAKLELERISGELEQRLARSPIQGIVTDLPKDPGEFISTNDPSVATIVRTDLLRVKFYVTTEQALQLSSEQSVKIQLAGGGFSQIMTGSIEYVSEITDADTETVRVEVVIDNRAGKLRSGIPCRLILESSQRQAAKKLSRL